MAGFTLKKNQLDPINTPLLRTWYHSRCANYSPTAATVEKFTITGGAILVHLMYGTIVTTLETAASNVSVVINPTTGTSGTVASTADGTALVAGDHIMVEGDGTAIIVAAGAAHWVASGVQGMWIADIGGIDVVHAAAQPGTLRWDLFWEPLDENSSVVGV